MYFNERLYISFISSFFITVPVGFDGETSAIAFVFLVIEFSIYENIEHHFLTGDMTILDGVGVLAKTPLRSRLHSDGFLLGSP